MPVAFRSFFFLRPSLSPHLHTLLAFTNCAEMPPAQRTFSAELTANVSHIITFTIDPAIISLPQSKHLILCRASSQNAYYYHFDIQVLLWFSYVKNNLYLCNVSSVML